MMPSKATIFMLRLLAVGILVTTTAKTCADCDELKLISKLNSHFGFDHNIFLFNSSVIDLNRYIETKKEPDQIVPQSVFVFESADDKFTALESLQEIKSKRTFMIVVSGSVTFENNLNLLTQVKKIQLRQIDMKIGIFYPHSVTRKDLHNLFEWSWKQRIINIFATTHSSQTEEIRDANSDPVNLLNIFTFNPFGTFKVVNITGSESYDNFFLSQRSNFEKYPIATLYTDYTRHVNEQLWLAIFDVMNVSLVRKESDAIAVLDEFCENEMCVLLHSVSSIDDFMISPVYPLGITEIVVVVPEALPYSGFAAIVKAFNSNSVLIIFIAIAVIITFLIFFRYRRLRKFVIFRSVADVLNLLISDNTYIRYQRLNDIEVLVIVPLTFAGLIIVNVSLGVLKSYLTSPIIQPQINTITDLYDSPFYIYTWADTWTNSTVKILSDQLKNVNWTDRVRTIDNYFLFNELVHSFNTSMAFIRDKYRADIQLNAQKRLNIRGYHISQVRLCPEIFTFLLNSDFPFIERVNEIIHRVTQSGLTSQWDLKRSAEYEEQLLEKNGEILGKREEVNVNNVDSDLTLILYGWVASAIVFVLEIIFKRFNF